MVIADATSVNHKGVALFLNILFDRFVLIIHSILFIPFQRNAIYCFGRVPFKEQIAKNCLCIYSLELHMLT